MSFEEEMLELIKQEHEFGRKMGRLEQQIDEYEMLIDLLEKRLEFPSEPVERGVQKFLHAFEQSVGKWVKALPKLFKH